MSRDLGTAVSDGIQEFQVINKRDGKATSADLSFLRHGELPRALSLQVLVEMPRPKRPSKSWKPYAPGEPFVQVANDGAMRRMTGAMMVPKNLPPDLLAKFIGKEYGFVNDEGKRLINETEYAKFEQSLKSVDLGAHLYDKHKKHMYPDRPEPLLTKAEKIKIEKEVKVELKSRGFGETHTNAMGTSLNYNIITVSSDALHRAATASRLTEPQPIRSSIRGTTPDLGRS